MRLDSIRLWPGIFLVIVWVSGCDFRVPFLIGEPEEAVISYEETEVGGPPCSTQSDCEEGNACVQFPSTTVCRLICEDYDELCGEKTSCKEVGAGGLGANVCQAFSLGGDIIPEEAPTLPCKTDEECQRFSSSAICGQFDGVRSCTIPCTEESDCDMYYLFFAEVNFLTCIPDEGAPNRTACLPDEMCFTEPERCIVGLSLLSPVEEDPSSTDESERDEESDSAESGSGL